MHGFKYVGLALLLAGATMTEAQETPLPEPGGVSKATIRDAGALFERALDDSTAWDVLESLTTEVGPRPAGSDGDRAAVAWALEKLEALGFDKVWAEPVEVPHWDRGHLEAEIVSPFPQPVVGVALGGSIGTTEEGIEAPVVAVETLDELKTLDRSEVEGKIVYIGSRMERLRTGGGYSPAVAKRGSGWIEASKLGAVGLVIRSVGTDQNRIAHTGAMRSDDEAKKIPSIAISNPDADLLERQLERGGPVTFRMKLSARNLPKEMSANVIGEIAGETDEIVLLGAHLDSWDAGTGAHDDGAGVAIVTAAAKLIGNLDHKPRRTIRVVLYANEEFGLSGAKAYAEKHADEIDRHVAAMEADFGAGRVWQFASRVPEEKLPVIAAIQSILDPEGIKWGGNESFGGADISPLRKAGVPIIGPRQDGTLYFDYHHTDNDTLDKVDPAQLRQNVAVYAAAAFIVASVDEDLGRIPVSEE